METREALIYAALAAFLEGDREFFFACESRWARSFAPDGPALVELIALARARREAGVVADVA